MTQETSAVAERQRWMHTLAMAETDALAAAWDEWAPKPEVEAIRGPEAGLVMVRSRIDARGNKFNLGEASVARATAVDDDALLASTTTSTPSSAAVRPAPVVRSTG